MKNIRIYLLFSFLLLPILLVGCDEEKPQTAWPQKLPTTQMSIGGQTFTIEIANEDKEREIGLMKRDSIPSDHGMIFVFPVEEPRAFWMKSTWIDLDIVYVRADGTIDSIAPLRAYDISSVPSAGPAKYAIEFNSGVAAKLGIKPGDKLSIPDVAKEPAQ